MKTFYPFQFVPEHADDLQRQRFLNRRILDSSARAVAMFHDVTIAMPTDANALDSLAARLCRDIDPTRQTMESLTNWFQG